KVNGGLSVHFKLVVGLLLHHYGTVINVFLGRWKQSIDYKCK
ncbi:hypothetical protein HMPREF0662_02258, partial [Prevotella nigrescens F0103]